MNKSRRSWLRIAILAFLALFFAVCLVGFAACGDDDGGTTGNDPVINPDEEDEDDDTTGGTTGGTTEGSIDKNKFEAEYTDIMGAVSGGSMFLGPDTKDMYVAVLEADDCSNGYCVGNMNYPKTYIYFEIESDSEAEADIYMSVSMNFECIPQGGGSKVTLTDEEFEVLVNTENDSERQQYGSIDYDMTGLSAWYTHKAFKEYKVGTVTLKKGTNTIILKTNNYTHTNVATMTATGPMVDYIRFDNTTATLSWTENTSVVDGTVGMSIGKTTLVS